MADLAEIVNPHRVPKRGRSKWCRGIAGRDHEWLWLPSCLTYGHNKPNTPQNIERMRDRLANVQNGTVGVVGVCRICGKKTFSRYNDGSLIVGFDFDTYLKDADHG